MTWISSSDLCVSKNKRLVYMMFYSRQPEFFQFLSQLSADKGVGEITFWTIHKVNDTTGKGERFYTDFPADNFMYDATSLLCVYLVYEAASKTIGWEADDCDDNTVKHFSFCDDRVNNYEEYESNFLYFIGLSLM
ncbi:Hypothetical predicted protein [Mytilus galloprovincialis]|uniref:C-type lectin domain-containing protein n=1 Tax=Mytilus galloprovincialis TaxID=29158 RepID=A0A8B6C6R8_MYTGA|nr:Hypothetical predicted protein [Mytilus galloprovincialis]